MVKTQIATLNAIQQIRNELPFEVNGIDSDNGSEFINELLFDYCTRSDVQFTRSQRYKKDDNAHIEQKTGHMYEGLWGITDTIQIWS